MSDQPTDSKQRAAGMVFPEGEKMLVSEGSIGLLEEIRQKKQGQAPAVLEPANEDIPEPAKLEAVDSWGGRARRNSATVDSLYKNAARTVLFTASNGETMLWEHDRRGSARLNAQGTVFVIRFGSDQIIIAGKRLDILRDAFEVHRVDEVKVLPREEFAASVSKFEHISGVTFLPIEPFEFNEKGEYQPLKED